MNEVTATPRQEVSALGKAPQTATEYSDQEVTEALAWLDELGHVA